MSDRVLLKFYLGPVQSFIEAARTIRDLWTGSYLISWLVMAALKKAQQCGAEISSPHVEGDPLRDLTACLPNHFEASLRTDAAEAQRIASACVEACRNEWLMIAASVLDRLREKFATLEGNWDRDWQRQIETFFEIRCVIVPGPNPTMDALNQLMEASRSVRHTPNYVPQADAHGQYGMKCSLLGTFEQIGPANLSQAKQFWEQLAGQGFEGTKLREQERFCAVSLVKRFAWPSYFAAKVAKQKHELRYSDTATVAAKMWLKESAINPDAIRRAHKHAGWSGQWLHWTSDNQAQANLNEEACPETVWREIQNAKRKTKPPVYYALLMMDGDHLGRLLMEEGKTARIANHQPITQRLSQFALQRVPHIVEEEFPGELIYAGGDDVLAFMPTAKALACAKALYKSYRTPAIMGAHPSATMSAGVVIAHYKEDLRFVLEEVRRAEREAKNAGRNKLALRVLRRSGEHAGIVLPWELVSGTKGANLQHLVQAYLGGDARRAPSDRWAYKLRAELPTLQTSKELFCVELKRLLNRLELDKERLAVFRDMVLRFFEQFTKEEATPETLTNFVTACQSASFLARGRDE